MQFCIRIDTTVAGSRLDSITSATSVLPKVFVRACTCALLVASCSGTSTGEKPVAEYDESTGHLSKIVLDANKNGKNDTVSYMDGTRIIRVELDLDENG